MSSRKKIDLEFPTNANGALTHQIRNFGEELWRTIERAGLGDVGGLEAIDRATDRIVVRIGHRKHIGTVRDLVNRALQTHMLAGVVRITYN